MNILNCILLACNKKCFNCFVFLPFVVSAAPGDNIHIHVTPRISRRKHLVVVVRLCFVCINSRMLTNPTAGKCFCFPN